MCAATVRTKTPVRGMSRSGHTAAMATSMDACTAKVTGRPDQVSKSTKEATVVDAAAEPIDS